VATLLIAFALFLLGGLAAVALQSRADSAQRLGQGGAVLGSLAGLGAAIAVLSGARPAALILRWPMLGGGIHLAIDPRLGLGEAGKMMRYSDPNAAGYPCAQALAADDSSPGSPMWRRPTRACRGSTRSAIV
jgi:hypothetical protein